MGLSPFVWGQGGRAVTPDQLARDREIAQALLAQSVDTSPVGHWAEGAARIAQAISGKIQMGRADRSMAEGQAGARSRLQQALAGGGGSVASALGGGQAAAVSAPSTMSVPTGERAQYIRAGLIQRGLPEHIADGFLANFKDESGLDPGINERNPTVPGSRGGFGLYQLTGPRRTAYENYVQQAGLNASDIDPQLDFLLSELKGPESKAWGQINASTDAAGAAQAIVNSFLRPAESHRAERAARYAGLGPSQASLESLPVGGTTQMAQAAPVAAQPTMGVSQALLQAASDPFLPRQDQAVAQALIEQQMAAQKQASDRAYDASVRQEGYAREDSRNSLLDARDLRDFNAGREDRREDVGFRERGLVPGSVREYEYYVAQEQQAGREPLPYNQWDLQGKKAGASSVNNILPGMEKFEEKFAEGDAKSLGEISTAGMSAQRNLGRLDQLQTLLDESGGGWQAALAQRAGEWGINTEGLGPVQAAQAAINSLVPEQRQPGSGPMSDADLNLFKQAVPRLINQPGGNQLIIQTMRGIAQYDAEGAAIVQRLRLPADDPNKLTRAQAFEALQNRVNPLSSFEMPKPDGSPAQADGWQTFGGVKIRKKQ